jgi:transposase InsO family protein
LANGHNLYLATVIDCCSRKLAGWAVADHMRTTLVTDALKAALADRGWWCGTGCAGGNAQPRHVLTPSCTPLS